MPDMISAPPVKTPVSDGKTNQQSWINWFQNVFYIAFSQSQSGTTSQRPTSVLWVGRRYFDTTLGKPVYIKSLGPTIWVDGVGTVS